MKSILQKEKRCYFESCDCLGALQEHHVFNGPYRKKSEKHGLKVYLCVGHHTGSKKAVHLNQSYDLILKKMAQIEYERTNTREEFIKEFGKSYL